MWLEQFQSVDILDVWKKGDLWLGWHETFVLDQMVEVEWVLVLDGKIKKPYFICPVSGRRARKLYLTRKGLACRQVVKVPYFNQTQTMSNRNAYAAHDIRAKLGCPGALYDPLIKPKGMWSKTFQKYELRYLRLVGDYFEYLQNMLHKIKERE